MKDCDFACCFYRCETLSLTLREENRLRVFESRVLRKMFGSPRDELTGAGENCMMMSLMICTPHQVLFRRRSQE
jgi:hypothetical protein